jgi:hypothetical protein
MATKVISTRIDEKLIERFDEKVTALSTTRNELIAKLISDFLGSDGIVDSTVDKSIQVAVDKAVDKGIQDAIASKTDEMRKEINDLKSTVNAVTKEFARYRDIEIDDLAARVVALETNRSEATAPANFTSALPPKVKEVAPLKLMELQKVA